MKIFSALQQIDFVLKMFAAAGFSNFSAAFAAKNENALKDFLAGQVKPVEKIVEKVIEPTDEQLMALVSAELRGHISAAGFALTADADPLAALKTGLTAHQALVSRTEAFSAGITAAGVQLPANATAEQITQAIEARVSLKVAELNGRLGTPPVAPELNNAPASAAKPPKSELKGLAKVQAAFEAEALQARCRRN